MFIVGRSNTPILAKKKSRFRFHFERKVCQIFERVEYIDYT